MEGQSSTVPASIPPGTPEGGLEPEADADVHRMVRQAQQEHGSLAELPWDALVRALAAWQPPRRRR